MHRILALLALLPSLALGALPTVTINGNLMMPDGVTAPSSGRITCRLSQAGSALDGGTSMRLASEWTTALGAGGGVNFTLVPNDQITPSGTAYICTIQVRSPALTSAFLSWSETWQLASSPNPVAIGAITRVATGGVTYLAGPVGPAGPTGATGPTGPTGPSVYDLAMSWIGRPIASEVLARIKIAHAFTVPSGCTGSQGAVGTNPAAAATVTVKRNGTSVATANISTGGTVTWTCAAPISIAAGDLVTFEAQAAADSTLADISLTITGAP